MVRETIETHSRVEIWSLTADSPASIWSPLVTATWRTVPATGDDTLVSIFMADSTTSGWPAFTVAPVQATLSVKVLCCE